MLLSPTDEQRQALLGLMRQTPVCGDQLEGYAMLWRVLNGHEVPPFKPGVLSLNAVEALAESLRDVREGRCQVPASYAAALIEVERELATFQRSREPQEMRGVA